MLPGIPLLVATHRLQPLFEDSGDLVDDWYRNAAYSTVFLYGYWLGLDAGPWDELARLRRRALVAALFFFIVYLVPVAMLPDDPPQWAERTVWTLRCLYIWTALCAILGWSRALLDRPWPWLRWANEAIYPWYIVHQSQMVLLACWLLPLGLNPIAEATLVLAGTIVGCWGGFAIVRRVPVLRPLFGLKARAAEGQGRNALTAVAPAAPVSAVPTERGCELRGRRSMRAGRGSQREAEPAGTTGSANGLMPSASWIAAGW